MIDAEKSYLRTLIMSDVMNNYILRNDDLFLFLKERKKLASIVSNGFHFLRGHCFLGPRRSLWKYHSPSLKDTVSKTIHRQSKYVACALAILYADA